MRKNEKGVTLIELLIALTLSSVVIIGLGSIYRIAKNTALKNMEDATLPANVQLIVDQMARDIRRAKHIKIISAKAISCKYDDPDNIQFSVVGDVISFWLNGDEIVRDKNGQQTTIATDVEELKFEEVPPDPKPANAVRISLTITATNPNNPKYSWTTSVSTTVNLRCSEGAKEHDPDV